jgi:anti-sigma regulatory factor (Ser/Thr protein kinase)
MATRRRPGSGLTSHAQVESSSSIGSDNPPGTVSHALPGDLSAVREARTVVQQVLSNWQAQEISDDVALVASELVANALRHGLKVGQPRVRIASRAPDCSMVDPDEVRISLVSTGTHVICAVTDPSKRPPIRRVADQLEGSGRGLQLVESLSLCWGWTVLDGEANSTSGGAEHGKSVWAIFPHDLANRSGGPARRQVVGAA